MAITFDSTGVQKTKKVKKPKAPSAMPTTPAAPVAKAPPAVAPPYAQPQNNPAVSTTPGPPPESLAGSQDRVGARQEYGTSLADINARILRAALDYGGVTKAQQGTYAGGVDGLGDIDVGSDPNSQIAQIERALSLGTTNVNNDLNARNSFFSGAHLDQQNQLNDEMSRQRLGAQTAYERAVGDLMTELQRARGVRDAGFGAADLADVSAASALPAQPEAATPTAPADAAASGGTPKAGYKFVSNSGPNAGLSYNLVLKNGKWYRHFEDNRWVPR